MNKQTPIIFPEIFDSFVDAQLSTDILSIVGDEHLPSWFKVTDLAAESITAAGLMLQQRAGTYKQSIQVDRRLASFWFDKSIRPMGWELPPAWDSIAGNYQAKDGWVRLHTNAALHKQAALEVLACEDSREVVADIVKGWLADDLAEAVIKAGGVATAMRTPEQWLAHQQGKAVAAEPLIHWDLLSPQQNGTEVSIQNNSDEINSSTTECDIKKNQKINPVKPLEGIKVLDLTRILSGPIATRFLAAYGADVLRIDPPCWDEPSTAPEVTLGKRCAGLNLRDPNDKATFEKLLSEADLLVHGYRPSALAGLGYDSASLRKINPRLVDVSLCAYGWTGPWTTRRGFDSVVQMSCGISAYGMEQAGTEQPVSLPVQALDHATGYLIAAAAIHALNIRDSTGAIYSARLSLARTACLLMTQTSDPKSTKFSKETKRDIDPSVEATEWGDARRIRFPLNIENMPAKWNSPAVSLHSSASKWSINEGV
jgi:crotonobetainyl-CoA:carnitine CoA-transferase CaiB-like acyl-CoA transferase